MPPKKIDGATGSATRRGSISPSTATALSALPSGAKIG